MTYDLEQSAEPEPPVAAEPEPEAARTLPPRDVVVGVVRESAPGERRVALAPADAAKLVKAGTTVLTEAGAGAEAGFPDDDYREAGVTFADRDEIFAQASVMLMVRAPGDNPSAGAADAEHLRSGQVVIGFCDPLGNPESARTLADKGATVFSMELVPRISRAQSMDALSSMANVAGYRAVLLGATHLPRLLPMMMTAAGTVNAARVFVMGAGVAGLQAIATAKRLGARVEAYDLRPEVKEQVQSVGASFVELDLEQATSGQGGYAAAQDEDFYRRQRELLAEVVRRSDIVVTTAAVPGRKSPVLVTREAVAAMKPGSVIVDLAAARGGNCEATVADETTVVDGVTILGPTNLPSEVPYHASQLYSRNVTTLLDHLRGDDGRFTPALDDEIVAGTLLCHDGEVVHPRLAGDGKPASTGAPQPAASDDIRETADA